MSAARYIGSDNVIDDINSDLEYMHCTLLRLKQHSYHHAKFITALRREIVKLTQLLTHEILENYM